MAKSGSKSKGKKSKFSIKIENVVAFSVLGVDISLNHVVSSIESAEYEPEQFPGLVYRTQDPRAAALIFSSGKIVCTGTKSIELAHVAMEKVVAKLREIGIKVPKKYPVNIENIVASSKIDAKLSLDDIAFSLEDAEYEPEQFPGLVYRIKEPRVAFLLFSSGKIICTGAHEIDDIYTALDKFRVKLEEIGVKATPSKPDDIDKKSK
ncbi:MAG: TATA-box-binding protein [Candidatus Micrarchaeota archaeon]|nr:TATA-box-binding protein [Candidatus Micrarchaeota archaeon]